MFSFNYVFSTMYADIMDKHENGMDRPLAWWLKSLEWNFTYGRSEVLPSGL